MYDSGGSVSVVVGTVVGVVATGSVVAGCVTAGATAVVGVSSAVSDNIPAGEE